MSGRALSNFSSILFLTSLDLISNAAFILEDLLLCDWSSKSLISGVLIGRGDAGDGLNCRGLGVGSRGTDLRSP